MTLSRRRRWSLQIGLATAAWLTLMGAAEADPRPSTGRVVAVGDVHGDLQHLLAILSRAGLIDGEQNWAGGTATLVQTGDLLDRGAESRQVLDLMIGLERQAASHGGRVVVLLGNHEVMNLMVDLRYVADGDFASFAGERSEELRQAAYQEYLRHRKARAKVTGEKLRPVTAETETAWMEGHPLGFLERLQAFSPDGRYGRWLRERPTAAHIGASIFIHGGLSPGMGVDLEAVNREVRQDLAAFDDSRQYLVDHDIILPFFTQYEMEAAVQSEVAAIRKRRFRRRVVSSHGNPFRPRRKESERFERLSAFLDFRSWTPVRREGPLWFRGYDEWSEEQLAPLVGRLLEANGAERVVSGHSTAEDGRVRVRLGGRLYLIDTGLGEGGRPSALEILAEEVRALYLDGEEVLWRREELAEPVEAPEPETALPAGTSRRVVESG